jgi:hypothetical protein
MSTTPTSTESGFKLGAEPKKVGLLVLFLVLAAFLFWRNSSDSPSSSSSAGSNNSEAHSSPQLPAGVNEHAPAVLHTTRRHGNQSQRNVFEMRPIDPSRGDIDPTLRLDLLDRLRTVTMATPGRSLFESGPSAVTPAPVQGKVIIPISKKPVQAPPPDTAQVTKPEPPPPPIPLKFYGFIRPANNREVKRGFFMDGDVVLVATEGETVKGHYRVVKFQESSATVEDTQIKNQQNLALVPEAKGEN